MARLKYNTNSRGVEMDGQVFSSAAEGRHYRNLLLWQAAGAIRDLRLQPRYTLMEPFKDGQGRHVRGVTYVADFEYVNAETGQRIAADVKGVKTAVFSIKERWFRWVYRDKIELLIVPAAEV